MKIKSILKNNKLLIAVILTYIVLLIISPEIFLKAADNSLYYLIENDSEFCLSFFVDYKIDVMIPKNVIMKGLGKDSGVKGYMFALLLGSLSAGPIYAAFQ